MFTISLFASSWAKKTDEILVQATQSGDGSAFEAIYEKYHKQIYSYLRNILNYNYDDTVNVTSDVFIKLYEYIKKNKVTNLKSMIYRIAHNAAIDCMRVHQQEYVSLDQYMELIPDEHQKHHSINLEFKQKLLESLLRKLEPQQREVLYLYYQESKSYEEIADVLGTNKNTIGTIIFNAKKKLNTMAEHHGIKEGLLL